MGGNIMEKTYNMGVDVGSTTVKTVILDGDEVIFKEYRRHFSDVKKAVKEILQDVYKKFGNIRISVVVTGSGGIDISNYLKLKFVQEVIASTKAIETYNPDTDVVIELGGEDAKISGADAKIGRHAALCHAHHHSMHHSCLRLEDEAKLLLQQSRYSVLSCFLHICYCFIIVFLKPHPLAASRLTPPLMEGSE